MPNRENNQWPQIITIILRIINIILLAATVTLLAMIYVELRHSSSRSEEQLRSNKEVINLINRQYRKEKGTNNDN